MAIRDILLHLDSSPATEARIDYAMGLARRHEAHLVGLYVVAVAPIHQYTEADLGPEMIEAHDRFMRESAAEAKALFERRLAGSGLSHEWREQEGHVAEMLGLSARYADLVVVGQRMPGRIDAGTVPELPDHVVFDSGRPALVVPWDSPPATQGSRILVAWNASRAVTRAVHDGLDLLRAADQVRVVAINAERGLSAHGDLPGADIATHLARHGVTVEVDEITTSRATIGDELLAQIAAMQADMMIMGSYSSFRLREMMFGGTTRRILERMTVPVLLSR